MQEILSRPYVCIAVMAMILFGGPRIDVANAQDEPERLLPEGLGFSNHLEYAYDCSIIRLSSSFSLSMASTPLRSGFRKRDWVR